MKWGKEMGELFIPEWGKLKTIESPELARQEQCETESAEPRACIFPVELPDPLWHERSRLLFHVKSSGDDLLLSLQNPNLIPPLAGALRTYARLGTTLYGRRFRSGHALLLSYHGELPESGNREIRISEGTLYVVWPGGQEQDVNILLSCRLGEALPFDCTFTLFNTQFEISGEALLVSELISQLPPLMRREAEDGKLYLKADPLQSITGITILKPALLAGERGTRIITSSLYTVLGHPCCGHVEVYRYGPTGGKLKAEIGRVWYPPSLQVHRRELSSIFPVRAMLTKHGPLYVYKGLYHGLPVRAITREALPVTVRIGGRTVLEAEYDPLREPLTKLEKLMATASRIARSAEPEQSMASQQTPAWRSIEAVRGMYEAAQREYPGAELVVIAKAELPGHVVVFNGRRAVIRLLKPWTRPGIYAVLSGEDLQRLLEKTGLTRFYKYAYEADRQERERMLQEMIEELRKSLEASENCESVCEDASLDEAVETILSTPAPDSPVLSLLGLYHSRRHNPTLKYYAKLIVDLIRLQNVSGRRNTELERRVALLTGPLAAAARLILATKGISRLGVNIHVNPFISYRNGVWVIEQGGHRPVGSVTLLIEIGEDKRTKRRTPTILAPRVTHGKIASINDEDAQDTTPSITIKPIDKKLLDEREHGRDELLKRETSLPRKTSLPKFILYEPEEL